jgi:serine/threonine protein kinase
MATGNQNTFPQQFGRYYLTQKIAMGGMAEIFRAKSLGAEGFEKVVVIKRILPHYSEDEGFVTMFKDEARVAAHLAHANVVQVFDFDMVNDLFYIAMEYVEGRDLKRVLDHGAKLGKPLSIAQAVHVMIEASQGLHYAHARVVDGQPLNIIHRDVSPHNVMVSFSGEVKIMDFGIAKAASRSTKTRVGTVKGKCAYMSPEQARGKPLDPRSDLFALGVLLWEMLTGKRLFVGESDFETLNNVLKAEVPAPSELNPEVPKELDAIVLKSLAREREDRQVDVGQFVSELRRWFYSSVPDPDAVSLKNYMTDLFADEIEVLRAEVAIEVQMMDGVRKGTGPSGKRPGTGSSSVPQVGGDDEKTMALDATGGLPATADSDRTMALPDAMSIPRLGPKPGIDSSRTLVGQMPDEPKKSKVGLFVGLGVAVALLVGVGAFLAMNGGNTTKDGTGPAAAAAAQPSTPAAPVAQVSVVIKAPGANEIVVDGETVSTDPECTFRGDKGREIKVLVKNGDRKKLVKHVLDTDGAVLSIELPAAAAPEPKAPAADSGAPVVLVQVEPRNATVTVNGAPVEAVGGNARVPNLKIGDTFKVEVKAAGYKAEARDLVVKSSVETFEIVLARDRPASASSGAAPVAAGPGKVVVSAKPWAKVSCKGKDLGLSPGPFTLPAGRYTLTLTKGSVTKTVTVTVKAGQTTQTSTDMTAP